MNTRLSHRPTRITLIASSLIVLVLVVLAGNSPGVKAQGGTWEAKYWNNPNLSGAPNLSRTDTSINFDWGAGSPANTINSDNFSAQWTQTANLSQGTYRFSATMDDGMRVWIDNVLIIDSWIDSQVRTITADVFLSAGSHAILVQYYEDGGLAVAKVGFLQLGGTTPTPPTPPPPPTPPAQAWFNEYFANASLSGNPALTGTTSAVNFNWGLGSPAPGFPADFFSVRWVRNLPLEAGRYRFTVPADDGVRLWVNNALIVDQWKVQPATTYNAEIDLAAGNIPVKVEYFENTGLARIQLTWVRLGAVPPPPPAATYQAEYFNNQNLSGAPVLVRGEATINNNWGTGSPATQVNADHFSARWTGNLSLSPGRYRFTITSDDGARLWVNNQLIIDAWFDRPAQTFTAEADVSGSSVPVRIEYYENTHLAEMRFSHTLVSSPPGTGGPGPGTATVTAFKLNVRFGPGVQFGVFAKVEMGDVLTLTGFRNGDASWIQVKLPNGTVGWVRSLYVTTSIPIVNLTPVSVPAPPPPPPPATGPTGVVNTGALNVRTGPGVEFPAFTAITNGTSVSLLARNSAGTWAKIILQDGRQGWVNATYLTMNVPISSLPVVNL